MALTQRLELDSSTLTAAMKKQLPHFNHVEVLAQVGSTNTELVKHVTELQARNMFGFGASNQWAAPSLLVAHHQTAGRGRTGRNWEAPAATSLTFSLHANLEVPPQVFTWLPLVVGTAVSSTLHRLYGLETYTKWPNDIIIGTAQEDIEGWKNYRKLGGILVERVGMHSVVIGVGINLFQQSRELPVPTATSVALETAALKLEGQAAGSSGNANPSTGVDAGEVLVEVVKAILQEISIWQAHGGDIEASGIGERVRTASATLGSWVRVEQGADQPLLGVATHLAPDGGLNVRDENGQTHVVHAGDVYHLRLH